MKKYGYYLVLLFLVSAGVCFAGNGSLTENYNKSEYRVEMRDGVKLFTAIYTPKDTTREYPFLILRTPYSVAPYGEEGYYDIPEYLAEEKFIFVYQDVRGKFMSEGEYVNMRPYIPGKTEGQTDESTDAYDTIEWLVNNVPGNNGKAGMIGISYPGFYAAMSLMESHPALKAVSPQAPIADWFIGDDMHHNGAFGLLLSFDFFSIFGLEREGLIKEWPNRPEFPSPDAYGFFLDMGPVKNADEKYLKGKVSYWNEITDHGTYDKFWQERNTLEHFENVTPAVMTVGGWYDGEDLYGTIKTYETIEKKNPGIYNILVMGPWFHGGWLRSQGENLGPVYFGAETSDYYRQNVELPFFVHFLKGGPEPDIPEALVFETGMNAWRDLDKYPADGSVKKLYLHPEEKVSFKKPASGREEYVSVTTDPARPIPYTDKIQDALAFYDKTYMTGDQRFAARRPDVMVFETEPLKNNITVSGTMEAELYVSTTGTDGDWVVKVIDVYPDKYDGPVVEGSDTEYDGYQQLVRGEIMRGKFRNSYVTPEPFLPGEVTPLSFTLNDVLHTFKKGHRIMIQVQGSWFPLFDRNPNSFTDIYNCDESAFRKAEQRVYVSPEYPSAVEITVVNSD